MALSSPGHALLRGPLGRSCLCCVGTFPLFLACFFSLPMSPLDLDQPFVRKSSGCCLHLSRITVLQEVALLWVSSAGGPTRAE